MEPSFRNRAEYERRLHRVLTFIDEHLDEPIDLSRLAKEANFSAFHFHRIFAAHVGETLGNYLTRRRVEQGAARLASQPRLGVLEVALGVGFGSAEAFSRAFKKHFGCTPSAWRARRPTRWDEKSKISQEDRRLDHADGARNAYAPSMAKTKTSSPLRVAVSTRPPVRIAYLRYQGRFGPPVGQFWQEKVYPWMVSNNLLGAPRYGVSHDDPDVTAGDKCRYDAGVEVDKDHVPSQGAQIAVLPGGLYASTPFRGTSDEIPEVWQRILREWLPDSGYQLDARPCFEYYPIDGEYDEKTGAFTCELCIPIAKL
jgi:AraC family transcriptional regulator